MKLWGLLQRKSESGSSAVSFAIIAPAFLLVVGFLFFAGRVSIAGNVVESAAVAAARDASLARTQSGAVANAEGAARRVLDEQGTSCSTLTINIDTSGFRAPLGQLGTVRATVICVANFSDIGIPGIPGEKSLTSSAISPVDSYRQR